MVSVIIIWLIEFYFIIHGSLVQWTFLFWSYSSKIDTSPVDQKQWKIFDCSPYPLNWSSMSHQIFTEIDLPCCSSQLFALFSFHYNQYYWVLPLDLISSLSGKLSKQWNFPHDPSPKTKNCSTIFILWQPYECVNNLLRYCLWICTEKVQTIFNSTNIA